MSKDVLYTRTDKRFLSEVADEYSSVGWNVGVENWGGSSKSVIESSLRVADCSRSVTIEFDIYDETDSVSQRIKKVDELVRSLLLFRDALEEAGTIREEYNKTHPEKEETPEE